MKVVLSMYFARTLSLSLGRMLWLRLCLVFGCLLPLVASEVVEDLQKLVRTVDAQPAGTSKILPEWEVELERIAAGFAGAIVADQDLLATAWSVGQSKNLPASPAARRVAVAIVDRMVEVPESDDNISAMSRLIGRYRFQTPAAERVATILERKGATGDANRLLLQALSGFDQPSAAGDAAIRTLLTKDWAEWWPKSDPSGHVGEWVVSPELRPALATKILRAISGQVPTPMSPPLRSWIGHLVRQADRYRALLTEADLEATIARMPELDTDRSFLVTSLLCVLTPKHQMPRLHRVLLESGMRALDEKLARRPQGQAAKGEDPQPIHLLLCAFIDPVVLDEPMRLLLRSHLAKTLPIQGQIDDWYGIERTAIFSVLWRSSSDPVAEFAALAAGRSYAHLRSKHPLLLPGYAEVLFEGAYETATPDPRLTARAGEFQADFSLSVSWPRWEGAADALARVCNRPVDEHTLAVLKRLAKEGPELQRIRGKVDFAQIANSEAFMSLYGHVRASLQYYLGGDRAAAEQTLASTIAQVREVSGISNDMLMTTLRLCLRIDPHSDLVTNLRAAYARTGTNKFVEWLIDEHRQAGTSPFPITSYEGLTERADCDEMCRVLADLGPRAQKSLADLRTPVVALRGARGYVPSRTLALLGALDRIELESRGLLQHLIPSAPSGQ